MRSERCAPMQTQRSSAERWADSAVLIPHRPSPLTSHPDNATIHKKKKKKMSHLRPGVALCLRPSGSSSQQRCSPTTVGGAKPRKKDSTAVTTYANDLTAYRMTSLWNGRTVNHHLVEKGTSAEAPQHMQPVTT